MWAGGVPSLPALFKDGDDMQTLSIDIETYSSISLQKSGVYRYVEAPDFEILLFGYSVDSGPVRVIDLACGEKIPEDIMEALTDDDVIKWAFNANFERICLSQHLKNLGISLDPFYDNHPLSTECARYLNPESWRCSMIWSATMGLPLSLEGVGAVLGLEKQKLTEGKDLIKFFCQPCAPTKANGQRTRNYPYHAPDKWAAFKRYNIRDVEAEMSIQERLQKFPVPRHAISDELNANSIPTKKGGRWTPTTVRGMVSNEKYTGDVIFQKTYTDSQFNRHINYGQKDRYAMSDHHEAIISREVFEAANALIAQRGKEKGIIKGSEKYQSHYCFSGKIVCGECGDTFKRRIHSTTTHKYAAWCCNTHIEDKRRCFMKYIRDDTVKAAFVTMINKLIFAHSIVLKPYVETLQNGCTDAPMRRIQQIQTLLLENAEQRETLTKLMAQGYID